MLDELNVFDKGEKENTVSKRNRPQKDDKGAKKSSKSKVRKSTAERTRFLEPVEDTTQLLETIVTPEELDNYKNPSSEMRLAAENIGAPPSAQDVDDYWEKATLSNDYLFGAVMCDEGLCSELLKRILPGLGELKIAKIQGQRVVEGGFGFRGMRLDIYAEDTKGDIYDIEMQVGNNKESLPKRMRFYQGNLDSTYLAKGENFTKLPKTYIVFICCFDPFDVGRMLYTFETYCTEDKKLKLNDGTVKVVVNAEGISENPRLKVFSDFIMNKPVEDDDFIHALKLKIQKIKDDRKYRKGYLMYNARLLNDSASEILKYGERKLEEGREEGRLLSIARGLSRSDEKTVRELLDATDDEINAANELLNSGEIEI